MLYRIQKEKVLSRPNFYSGIEPVTTWIADEYFQPFETRIEAMRTWLFSMQEISSLDYGTDKHIRAMFKGFRHLVRINRISQS